jgi:hypothetical protein
MEARAVVVGIDGYAHQPLTSAVRVDDLLGQLRFAEPAKQAFFVDACRDPVLGETIGVAPPLICPPSAIRRACHRPGRALCRLTAGESARRARRPGRGDDKTYRLGAPRPTFYRCDKAGSEAMKAEGEADDRLVKAHPGQR